MKKLKVLFKQYLLIICCLFILGAIYCGVFYTKDAPQSLESQNTDTESKPEVEENKSQLTEALPASDLLKVPYTVQAPNYSWDIHDESCEEAAALMYHYFLTPKLTNTKVIPTETANKEFLKMKSWQKSHYGKEPDLSIQKIGVFIKEYYGYQYRTKKNITINDIKTEIAAGNPVVVPVMTHSLGNPNYGRDNSYHVLLIKGYNAKGIITNDAGISKGRDYFYTWKILFRAIDDQSERMNQGREMLVITR